VWSVRAEFGEGCTVLSTGLTGCNLIVGVPSLVLFSVYTLPTALFVLFRPS
jgi:hypothetical protein